MYMLLTQIVRYSWKRDGFRIIRPDRLIPGASDVASSGGGSPIAGTGGATGCSSVLSSRNVTRRRVCSVASLRMFSASSSLRCDQVLRNLDAVAARWSVAGSAASASGDDSVV